MSDASLGENPRFREDPPRIESEVDTCRRLSRNFIFVIGPGRSGTTLLAALVNSSDRALITLEANLQSFGTDADFREIYNRKHKMARHTRWHGPYAPDARWKGVYAPNFCKPGSTSWVDWFLNASTYYSYVGDKIALGAHMFHETPAESFVDFFERRFFGAKYVLTLRDPVQAILSTVKLVKISEADAIAGWLTAAIVWSNFISIFPSTTTLFQEEFDAQGLPALEDFLGFSLSRGASLLNVASRTNHTPPSESLVGQYSDHLSEIYSEMKRAALLSPGQVRPAGPDSKCEPPADKVCRLSAELMAIVEPRTSLRTA